MTDQPRDWDREMADIDRVLAKQGSTPAPPKSGGSIAPSGRATPPAAPGARRGSVALTWFWVLLAVALGVALVLWPYQRGCGLQLLFFLGAVGVTALAAVMGALASWAHRRGFAHVVSLLVLLWAGFVALRETLPRVGYARASLDWTCATPASSATPARLPGAAAPSSGTAAPAPATGAAPTP